MPDPCSLLNVSRDAIVRYGLDAFPNPYASPRDVFILTQAEQSFESTAKRARAASLVCGSTDPHTAGGVNVMHVLRPFFLYIDMFALTPL